MDFWLVRQVGSPLVDEVGDVLRVQLFEQGVRLLHD